MKRKSIIGIFAFVDDTISAIKELRRAGIKGYEILSPIPSHDIEHVLEQHKEESFLNFSLNSVITAIKNRDFHVMRVTALGASTMSFLLMLLAFVTAIIYPIQTGGLPIISLPPIGWIGMITFCWGGVIFSVVGFLFLAKLPSYNLGTYDKSVSDDKFAIVFITEDEDQQSIARTIFKKCKATEIKEEDN